MWDIVVFPTDMSKSSSVRKTSGIIKNLETDELKELLKYIEEIGVADLKTILQRELDVRKGKVVK